MFFNLSFDNNNNNLYEKRIFKIRGSIKDVSTGKVLSVKKACLTDKGIVNVSFEAVFELSNNLNSSINNNNVLNFVILGQKSIKAIKATTDNELIDISKIMSIVGSDVNNLTIEEILNDVFKEKASAIKTQSFNIMIEANSYDLALEEKNIDYLKDTLKFNNDDFNSLYKDTISQTGYSYFKIKPFKDVGLSFTSSNLFKHHDDVINVNVEEFYTYSDIVKINLNSYNASEMYIKYANETSPTSLQITKEIGEEDVELKKATITLNTISEGIYSFQIYQKTESGSLDEPIVFKIIKLNKSDIKPTIVYNEIQDDITNNNEYNMSGINWLLKDNKDIYKYEYEIHSDSIVEQLQTINKSDFNNGEFLINFQTENKNKTYSLILYIYDLSGRNIKKVKYNVLYLDNKIKPENIICENSSGKEDGFVIVNDNIIKISFANQNYKNINYYKININNSYSFNLKQAISGANKVTLSHLGGSKLESDDYYINITPVNKLGSECQTEQVKIRLALIPNFITVKQETFINNNINDLKLNVTSYDINNTYDFKIKLEYTDKVGFYKSSDFYSKETNITIPDIIKNNIKSKTKVSIKVFCRNKNLFVNENSFANISCYFNQDKPFITDDDIIFLENTKDKKPIFLLKRKADIYSIEVIMNNKKYNVNNNIFYPNEDLGVGTYQVQFIFKDIYSNETSIIKNVLINENEKYSIVDDVVVKTNSPSYIMEYFSNINLDSVFEKILIKSNIGIEQIISTNIDNINININNEMNSGIYIYNIFAYNFNTGRYDILIKTSKIVLIKEKPTMPKILNKTDNNIIYTKGNSFILNFITEGIMTYIDKIILETKIEGGETIYSILDKTDISKEIDLSSCVNAVKTVNIKLYTVGINEQDSDINSLKLHVLNKEPKPLVFDLSPEYNLKYDNSTNGFKFNFKDENPEIQKITHIKFNLNKTTETQIKPINDFLDTDTGYFKYTLHNVYEGSNKLYAIGYDKAGNQTTIDDNELIELTKIYFSDKGINKQYGFFEKIIDTKKPIVITDNKVFIEKNANNLFNNFNVYFDLPDNELCFLDFELIKTDTAENSIIAKGNTYLKQDNIKNILIDSRINKGIDSLYSDVVEILNQDDNQPNTFENIYLAFKNIPVGKYLIKLKTIDISLNESDIYNKEIEIVNIESKSPNILSPVGIYSNLDSLLFEWNIDIENIKEYEYEFSTTSAFNDGNLRTTSDKFIKFDTLTDSKYFFRVRAVTNNIEKNDKNIKTNFSYKTITVDRKKPLGITFLNKTITNDNTILKFNWEYVHDKDNVIAEGVYVSFNPNANLSEWEKLINTTTYVSSKKREDGVYTLFAKTFDKAGNINDDIFSSSIIVDTIAPDKVELKEQVETIYSNEVPEINFINNISINQFLWILIDRNKKETFINNYNNLNLSNEEKKYIFNSSYNNEENIRQEVKDIIRNNNIVKNEPVTISSLIPIYEPTSKPSGIKENGYYTFFVVGLDNSGLVSKELTHIDINYNKDLPSLDSVKIIKPFSYAINTNKPEIEVETLSDIVTIIITIERNNETIISKEINTYENIGSQRFFTYNVPFNLPVSEYILSVDAFNKYNKNVSIEKIFSIENNNENLFSDSANVFIPSINCNATIKKIRGVNSYVFSYINIPNNSIIYYKENGSTNWEMLIINKTELQLEKNYNFKINSYSIF